MSTGREQPRKAAIRIVAVTPETVFRALFVENNLTTYRVLLDRAAWFRKSYEALTLNRASLRDVEDTLSAGPSKDAHIACSYAYAVFLVSAVEVLLLMLYTNSVVLLHNWKGTIPTLLSRSLDQKRKGRRVGSVPEELRSLSLANMAQAEQWFEELYGENVISRSLTKAAYKKFRARFDDLVATRNGILHRGGETKKGGFIEVPLEELQSFQQEAEVFGNRLANAVLDWWLERLRNDKSLGRAVLKSV